MVFGTAVGDVGVGVFGEGMVRIMCSEITECFPGGVGDGGGSGEATGVVLFEDES